MRLARTYLRKERLLRVRTIGIVRRRSKTRDNGFTTIILLETTSLGARDLVKRPTVIKKIVNIQFSISLSGDTNAGTALRASRQC